MEGLMTMRPSRTTRDEHANRLRGVASRLDLLWDITRDAQRMGRPADAELTEFRALKAGYTARDLRQER
jgi:hypothetical protein